MRVGLVSDSHGLADPKLPGLFEGCALILHAGDVVKPSLLAPLEAIAPLRVVRGNNDVDPAFARYPETALVPLGPFTALLVHDLGPRDRPHAALRRLIARERPALVVHGHSHRPGAEALDGVLYVNPGSAGPRRFSLPRTAGLLELRGGRIVVTLLDLAGAEAAPLGAPLTFSP